METLYHYTDLNAFLSIIRNGKLWLTGANNLNDHQEINWTHQKIDRRLNELSKIHGPERSAEICALIKASSGVPYVCSLSSESDLLSQWRAYGQNGSGVAIGFKRSALPGLECLPILTFDKKSSVSLQQVVYDEEIQEQLIESILVPVFEGKDIDDDAHYAMSMAASKLVGLSCFFKNPAFSEEKEWRIIHRTVINGGGGGLESKICMSTSPSKYRVSGGRLITYFEYDFEKIEPQEIFADIVLGPKSDVSNFDLSIFMTEAGLPNISVRRSRASYR